MLGKKVDVILFYDSKNREFNSLKILREQLLKLNVSNVVLPVHFRRYYYALKYKPKVVLLPFMYNKDDGNYLLYKTLYDPIFINIHSEQIYNGDSKKLLMPQDQHAKDVIHYVWGEKFKKQLMEIGIDENKISITGSIRNDTISRNKSVDHINTILVPSSFGMTIMPDSYVEEVARVVGTDKLKRQLKFMEESRIQFFRIISKIAISRPNIKFILRPHPHVDIQRFKKTFLRDTNEYRVHDNIQIERKGDIFEFFKEGELVIAWHSTTILEAALSNRKSIVLAPIEFPNWMEMEYFKYFTLTNCYDDTLRIIDGTTIETNEIDDYIKEVYFKIDGQSGVRMAREINGIIKKSKYQRKIKFNVFIRVLFKLLSTDFVKEILIRLSLLDKLVPSYKGNMENIGSIE